MKPKRLPRLWCALQGLLPLEAGRVANPRAGSAGISSCEAAGLRASVVSGPGNRAQFVVGRDEVVAEAIPLPFNSQ